MSKTPFPGETLYGTWPEPYRVAEDRAAGVIALSTPFYEVEHDLSRGGAIRCVRYPQASGENLLLSPMGCEVAVAGAGAPLSTLADAQARVDVARDGDVVRVTVEGVLCGPDGQRSGIEYRFVYEYRWGAIRLRQQLRFPKEGLRVSRLSLLQWHLRPQLGAYGIRPGAHAETSPWTGAFGTLQSGRYLPGASFDCAQESRFVPRTIFCADAGREGIEWFPGSDLSQWDYQVCGRPGYGHFHLGPHSNPPAIHCSVSPVHVPGSVVLAGELTFDSWIGLPILSGRAHRPFLHASFNRKNWPTREGIRDWAESGIRTAHFHHDGDTFRDGLFWRDGSYPPFGAEDMAEYDRVICTCQEHGIRVATYFSNKELHPTTDAYKAHGAEWARLPGDRGEQLHNAYSGDEYGAQMCLRSGWLEQLKQNIDAVLNNHPLDGVYYDWNVALYCHNPAHAPVKDPGEHPGFGSWAFSPAGHWDVDELVDLMEWTRRRVGRDGLVIIHNTMAPSAVTENFADHVVAMEWGYGKLSVGAPDLASLPLEWNFLGARPRGVIGYGCLEKDAPESVHRQMTLRCMLTGTAPWPALPLDREMFLPLRDLDLSGYRFFDWRSSPAGIGGVGTASAVYAGAEDAWVILANLTSQPWKVRANLAPVVLILGEGEWVVRREGTALPAAEEMTVELPGDGAVVLRVERA